MNNIINFNSKMGTKTNEKKGWNSIPIIPKNEETLDLKGFGVLYDISEEEFYQLVESHIYKLKAIIKKLISEDKRIFTYNDLVNWYYDEIRLPFAYLLSTFKTISTFVEVSLEQFINDIILYERNVYHRTNLVDDSSFPKINYAQEYINHREAFTRDMDKIIIGLSKYYNENSRAFKATSAKIVLDKLGINLYEPMLEVCEDNDLLITCLYSKVHSVKSILDRIDTLEYSTIYEKEIDYIDPSIYCYDDFELLLRNTILNNYNYITNNTSRITKISEHNTLTFIQLSSKEVIKLNQYVMDRLQIIIEKITDTKYKVSVKFKFLTKPE